MIDMKLSWNRKVEIVGKWQFLLENKMFWNTYTQFRYQWRLGLHSCQSWKILSLEQKGITVPTFNGSVLNCSTNKKLGWAKQYKYKYFTWLLAVELKYLTVGNSMAGHIHTEVRRHFTWYLWVSYIQLLTFVLTWICCWLGVVFCGFLVG